MDLRAKRVGAALGVPRGVMGIKIPKDEGGGGRREKRGAKSPIARDRSSTKRGDIDIEK